MGAAVGGSDAGLTRILLLERHPRLGGILNQCVHMGFGLKFFKEELTGPEYAYRYIDMLWQRGIEVRLSASVHRITPSREVSFISRSGEFALSSENIVVATGCRERTREMTSVPGTRPSGIFTAGLAQEMVNVYGVMPGKEVVIVGSGDIGMIMARRMTIESATVHAVLEIMDHHSGLLRNKIQCLDDFNIPLHLEHEVLEILGRNRVEGIRFRNNRTGSEKFISCDTVLFSVGLIPERDLLIEAGIEPGRGIYLAGNADHVHDTADRVTLEAERLGRSLRVPPL